MMELSLHQLATACREQLEELIALYAFLMQGRDSFSSYVIA
jgi:hypothetical protein